MATVSVSTYETEMEFSIRSSTTAKMLFEQVVRTIGLREIWYFGLYYIDVKGVPSWLKLDKKVLQQDVKKEPKLQFKFRAKFYPEDVAEIIQYPTLRLFYLQVREQILTDEIYCPAETAVLLASYAMQAKYGDFNPNVHKVGYLATDRLLPPRVIGQYKLTSEEWEKRVMGWWADHKNNSIEACMMEYLRMAQDLEMYGINYFEIRNKKDTQLYLGVDALGLNVYDKDDKLNPKVGFPWSEIRNISYNSKRFVIKHIDKSEFVFYAPRLRINKRILSLCMGNHELYMRRRRPDSIEIQQMKQQAEEERAQRQLEQERLNNAREAAEQKQREYEARIQKMQAEMDRAHNELEYAQQTIRQLNNQLLELSAAKAELAKRESDLIELNRQLQSECQLNEEERHRLISEIATRETQVAKLRSQVHQKTSETDKLQREVDETNARQQHKNPAFFDPVKEHHGDDLTNVHVELSVGYEMSVTQKELDRVTVMEQNVKMKKKLEDLSTDLDKVKDHSALTDYDMLHMENKRTGRDKYKTLRQIRGGNTKRRIDQYENM